MPNYIHIGTIVATSGLQGAVILRHELGEDVDLQALSPIYIAPNPDSFIPYFPESLTARRPAEALVKLDGTDSRETARSLIKKKVYLERELFDRLVSPDSDLFYLGFTIVDEKEGALGKIVEIIRSPDQLIARIDEGPHELLIPLSAHTLQRTDRANKRLYVRLPDGLLDVYRS